MSNAIDFALGYNLAPMRSGGSEAIAINQKVMDRMSAGVKGLSTAWQAFTGLAAVGLAVGAAKSLGAFASEIRDLSDTTGLSTDMFQRYSFAVSQSGGSQEVFTKGMIAIQQAQQSALTGNEKAIASFAALGITLGNLRTLSPDQLFLAFADAMKSSGGSAESFAALAELVGVKVATKLVPSLKLGSDGFVELGKSANIASEEAVNAAEAAQDAWDKFLRETKVAGLESFKWFNDLDLNGTTAMRNSIARRDALKAFEKSYVPMPVGFDPTQTDRQGPFMQDFQPGVVEGFEQFGPPSPARGPTDEENAVAAARAKAAEDIYAIEQKIARLKLEGGREQMSQLELIASLENERAGLLRSSRGMEGAFDSKLRVMAAQLRLQAEEVGSRIAKARSSFQAGQSTGEQFGPTLADLAGGSAARAASGGASRKGGEGAGLWSSGGLISGGAAALSRARGMGLGRPSSVTSRGGPQERMAGDMRELLTLWKRG